MWGSALSDKATLQHSHTMLRPQHRAQHVHTHTHLELRLQQLPSIINQHGKVQSLQVHQARQAVMQLLTRVWPQAAVLHTASQL